MSVERRYEVIEALGTGGFGTVYRARYLGEGGFTQMVALKVLNPEMAAIGEIASRLRDEARMMGLVRHRAIVQVHRLVQLDESWTVVMELVEGADLAQVLKAGIEVPVGPALEMVAEVAAALHVAWSSPGPDGRPLRLLHRDIKPSNIQITPVGEVKVLDFGIARADFDEREAMTRKLAFGSTEYMAPERLDMMDGPAADVYSLGAVLFEILTGRAFGRTSAVRERHVPRVDKALTVLREKLGLRHDAVVELVGDMLTWDPTLRPEARTVERRALSLRGHIAGEPLRFWAEDHIPKAMAAREIHADRSRTGSILVERPGEGTSSESIGPAGWGDAPEGVAAADATPGKKIKRRASDPTDAPSVAFTIGPQPKAPRQLGPGAATPLPPEPTDEQGFRPMSGGAPASPTLVALMDPLPASSRDLAALAAATPAAATPATATPATATPATATPAAATPAAVAPAAVAPPPEAELPVVPAAPVAAPVVPAPVVPTPVDDATDEWTPPPRRGSPALPLFAFAGLVGLVGLAWVLLQGDGAPDPAPAGVSVPATEPAPSAEDPQDEPAASTSGAGAPTAAPADPAPAPAASPPPATPAASTATPRAPEPAAPAPSAAEPEPEEDGWAQPEPSPPPAAAVEPAHVTVTGDVKRVSLQGPDGTIQVSKGTVPPGRYEIWVRFEGRADRAAGKAGTITLAAGERVTLHCDQLFAECTRK